MPDHIVSGDVDSMLRSANDAAIRSAIGVGTTDAPTFAGVTSTGVLTIPVGSKTSTSVRFGTQGATTGLYSSNSGTSPGIALAISGDVYLATTDSSRGLTLHSNWPLSWGSAGADSTTDLFIQRDAPGILAQRNVAVAQALRVYNSTDATPATNYDRGVFDFKTTTNTLRIGTENGGTYTTARPIDFVTGGVVRMSIGAAGGLAVANSITSGASISAGGGSYIMWSNGTSSRMLAPSDGVIQLTNAATTGFTRLELGATNLGISRGTGTPEGVVTALVGSLYIRTDGGASTTLYVKESSPTPSTGWVAK